MSSKEVSIQGIRLHTCLEGQEGISSIGHLENATEAILSQITDFQYFQLGRVRAQIQFGDYDIVDNDRGFRRFVQSRSEQILGPGVEARVCHERRPVEVERHDDDAST